MSNPEGEAMREYMRIYAQQAQPIPGGCDSCNAYQRVVEVADGVFQIGVFHDDWCSEHPELRN